MLSDLLSQNTVSVFVALVITLIAYYEYKWRFSYWKRKKLPHLQPKFPFGNMSNPFKRKEHFGITMKKVYDEMKERNWKHGGLYFFSSPTYIVIDLDYVKNIMTKDFHHFVDRGGYYNEKDDPLSAHLFNIGSPKWRNLRTKLTPTFTSGKMKTMFQTLVDCVDRLLAKIELECKNQAPIDIKDVLGCFTTDVIGHCAFGLDFKTFEDEHSPFREYGKTIFTTTTFRSLKRTFASSFPNIAKKIGVTTIPRDISNFFMKLVKDTVSYREKNNYTRQDFMQLLIDLKNGEDDKTISIEEIAAQCFVFFLAGFETSSTAMTFALYELSKNQDLQERLRNEINTVLAKNGGKLTYDAIQDMKYMNQVVDETLRKYPPGALLTRKCIQDYKIPNENITIQKGTLVIIPVLGIHHDEEYYPDPEKFDPERFSDGNKESRHNYAHIPFGEGPRNCIGMRFGLMQTKVGLTSLLKNYKFTVNQRTQEPLKMQPQSFVLAAEGEIWLNGHKL